MVQVICTYQNITSGSITVGCNKISVLQSAFNTDVALSLNMADYDILYAIRNVLQKSMLTGSLQHVRGHQDNEKYSHQLSRLEKLHQKKILK